MDEIYCPKIRKDCYFNPLFVSKKGKGYYIFGNKSQQSQMLIKSDNIESFKKLIGLLDGNRNIHELLMYDNTTNNTKFMKVIQTLYENGMLEDTIKQQRFSESEAFAKTIYRHKFLDTSKYQCKCIYLVRVFYFLLILGFIFLLAIFLKEFSFWNEIKNYLFTKTDRNFINQPIVVYIFSIIITPFMFLGHELAHSIFAISCGIEVDSLTLSLYYGIKPMAYVKQRNLYSLPKKYVYKVLSAGILFNTIIFLYSLIGNFFTNNPYFLALAWSNFKLIYTNLVPFSLTDGYFIMCLITNLPNLRYNMYKIYGYPKEFFKLSKERKIFILIKIVSAIILFNIEIKIICSLINITDNIGIYTFCDLLYIIVLHLLSKTKIKLKD